MITNTAIKNQIRENQIFQIVNSIELSVSQGMQTMGQALESLVARGIITQAEAARFIEAE